DPLPTSGGERAEPPLPNCGPAMRPRRWSQGRGWRSRHESQEECCRADSCDLSPFGASCRHLIFHRLTEADDFAHMRVIFDRVEEECSDSTERHGEAAGRKVVDRCAKAGG